MPIINQNLDIGLQQSSFEGALAPVVNGGLIPVCIVPFTANVVKAQVTMSGTSGSPNVILFGNRFSSAGGISFPIGSTFAVTNYGTSGSMSYSLPAVGSSQLSLQKGDYIVAIQGGGSAAASNATIIELIIQDLQDYTSWY